jgi:hypothetical protein
MNHGTCIYYYSSLQQYFKAMNSSKNIKIILCGITGGWSKLSKCKMAFTGQKKISRILVGAKPANSHVKYIIINP